MQLNIKKLSPALFRGAVVATLLFACVSAGTARADDTWTQTSQADFESGTLFHLDTSSSPGDVKLARAGGGNYAYALRGKNFRYFWRYDASTDSWTSLALAPATVGCGGALAMVGASYYASGTLTSSAHDAGYAADFGTISWTATAPAGTSVKFQLASNTDNSTWSFVGPDGASGTYYTSSGQAIWSGHDGDRYLKYKAYLATADTGKTPVLYDISITCAPQIVLPAVATGAATLVEETTATLHGTVTGDGGEACQYRFEYGTVSGNYTADTGWDGSKTTGQSFSVGVTGLAKGTRCYFRAQAKNSSGTGSGTGLNFLTKPEPPVLPVAVGGMILEVNKAQVLAPWLCLFLVVSLAAGGIAVRLTRKAG